MKNKGLIIISSILAVTLIVAAIIINSATLHVDYKKPEIEYKNKEIVNRLLAVPVVLYHHIDGRGAYSVSEVQLQQHFQLIQQSGVKVIPLKQLVFHLQHKKPFKQKVMVITFDDGFNSAYTKLLPLVRQYKYPVTLFVYTDFIKVRSKRNLTWNRLKKMQQADIDIQCHSRSHADLAALCKNSSICLQNKRQLYDEMHRAKQTIELYLGKKIDYFAFPYGRYNLHVIELAKAAGYKRVFSTNFGANIVSRDNFCINRHHILANYSIAKYKKIILKML